MGPVSLLVGVFINLLGWAISTYMSIAHFEAPSSVCGDANGPI